MRAAAQPLRNEIFAGNRAVGRIALHRRGRAGGSRRGRVPRSTARCGCAFPNGDSEPRSKPSSSTPRGGMAGGDRFDIDITVGAGARLTVTTAAAEKIYRSLGPDTDDRREARRRSPAARLAWLPQETILFDQARLRRTHRCRACAATPVCCWRKPSCSAAPPWARRCVQGHLFDRWRVRVGGALVFAETLRLDGAIAQRLAQRAVASGGVAVASVLKCPGDDADAAAVRAHAATISPAKSASRPGTGSPWRGLLRRDGAALRRDLVAVLDRARCARRCRGCG